MDVWTEILVPVIKGWARIALSVAIGTGLGVFLEISGILEKISARLRLNRRLGDMPPACGSTFLLAFASPRSANSMLASLHADGRVSRRSLVLGGISHTFPASSIHIRNNALVLIPLLGAAGAGYVLFQLALNALCSAMAPVIGCFWKESDESANTDKRPVHLVGSRGKFLALFRERVLRLGKRVMIITFPMYTLVVILSRTGVFARLNGLLPSRMASVLPVESLGIISAHLIGVMNAASVARPFLSDGILTTTQVFVTLVAGYLIGLPIRTLRHALPSALGIFPGRTGLGIVGFVQGFKALASLAVVMVSIHVFAGGTA